MASWLGQWQIELLTFRCSTIRIRIDRHHHLSARNSHQLSMVMKCFEAISSHFLRLKVTATIDGVDSTLNWAQLLLAKHPLFQSDVIFKVEGQSYFDHWTVLPPHRICASFQFVFRKLPQHLPLIECEWVCVIVRSHEFRINWRLKNYFDLTWISTENMIRNSKFVSESSQTRYFD